MRRLTDRQERFATLVVSGESLVDAYKQAGYAWQRMSANTLRVEACRLRGRDNVAARIEELQGQAAADARLTRDWKRETLGKIADQAIDAGQNAAAVQAIMGLARLDGEIVGKQEVTRVAPKDWRAMKPKGLTRSPDFETLLERLKSEPSVAQELARISATLEATADKSPFEQTMARVRAHDELEKLAECANAKPI